VIILPFAGGEGSGFPPSNCSGAFAHTQNQPNVLEAPDVLEGCVAEFLTVRNSERERRLCAGPLSMGVGSIRLCVVSQLFEARCK
jgi:hypothetical protein